MISPGNNCSNADAKLKQTWAFINKRWLLADIIEERNADNVVIVRPIAAGADDADVSVENCNTFPIDPTHLESLNDLCHMNNLHDGPLMYTLWQRYSNDKIYTNVGNVLLAINPYKSIIGMYDNPANHYLKHRAAGGKQGEMPPHIFNTASQAYQNLENLLINNSLKGSVSNIIAEQKNQSIIISGESGAGKTEACKQLLNFLLQVDLYLHRVNNKQAEGSAIVSPTMRTMMQLFPVIDVGDFDGGRVEIAGREGVVMSSQQLSQRLAQSGILFESFGNAKTLKNDNSSRFGKFILLHYSPCAVGTGVNLGGVGSSGRFYALSSAQTDTFLLEKSRLTTITSSGERNYHIFYQLLSAWGHLSFSHQSRRHSSVEADQEYTGDEVKILGFGELGLPPSTPAAFKRFRMLYPTSAANNKASRRPTKGTKDPGAGSVSVGVGTEEDPEASAIAMQLDCDNFYLLLNALDVLKISQTEQRNLFELMVCIMHLSNIDVNKHRDRGSDTDTGGSEYAAPLLVCPTLDMSVLCGSPQMLGVSVAEFTKAITTQRIAVRGRSSVSYRQMSPEESLTTIAALMKYLYNCLFTWLVSRVNNTNTRNIIDCEAMYEKSIGILDIFGFEILAHNSLEQLCINYTNELLQSQFNSQIFIVEQRLYIEEGMVNWATINFTDNQDIIDLMVRKPYGLYHLLEEHGRLKTATDAALFAAFCTHHGSSTTTGAQGANSPMASRPTVDSAVFQKSKFGNGGFSVKHFAGEVTYAVDGFLLKNHMTMSKDIVETLMITSNGFIKTIVTRYEEEEAALVQQMNSSSATEKDSKPSGRGKGKGKMASAITVSYQFRTQLDTLMATIGNTVPHYVKCIKPNMTKKPAPEFAYNIVMEQMNYSGIMEVIRIRREGYPLRVGFEEFLNQFEALFRLAPWRRDFFALCAKNSRESSPSKTASGTPKIRATPTQETFKGYVNNVLNDPFIRKFIHLRNGENNSDPGHLVTTDIDTTVTEQPPMFQLGYVKVFLKDNGLKLMTIVTNDVLSYYANKIISAYKRRVCHGHYHGLRSACIVVQKYYRRHLCVSFWTFLKRTIVLMQMAIRRYLFELRCRRRKAIKDKLQAQHALVMAFLRRRVWKMRIRKAASTRRGLVAAIAIQKVARGWLCKHRWNLVEMGCLCIQTYWRRHSATKVAFERRNQARLLSVVRCQAAWRMHLGKRGARSRRRHATKITSFGRMIVCRSRLLATISRFLKVHKLARGFIGRRRLGRYVAAITRIQAYSRMRTSMLVVDMQLCKLVRLQSMFRRVLCTQRLAFMLSRCHLIQHHTRRFLFRRKYENCKEAMRAATVLIQKTARGCRRRLQFKSAVCTVKRLQCWLRQSAVRRQYQQKMRALLLLQCCARRMRARAVSKRRLSALLRLQSVRRMLLARSRYRHSLRRIICAQSCIRLHLALRGRTQARAACVVIQTLQRCRSATRCWLILRTRVRRIQATIRMSLCKLRYAKTLKGIVLVQSCVRGHLVLQNLSTQRWATVHIQSVYRRYAARKRWHVTLLAASVIQAGYRMRYVRKRYDKSRRDIVRAQSCVRRYLSVQTQKFRCLAATVIQSLFRCHAGKQRWGSTLLAAQAIQAGFRMHACRCQYHKTRCDIKRVQSIVRRYLTLQMVGGQHMAAVALQSACRRFIARRRWFTVLLASCIIQAGARMHAQRTAYRKALSNIVCVQSCARRYLTIQTLRTETLACVVVQSVYRRYAARSRWFLALLAACILQSGFRMWACSERYRKARNDIVCAQACARRHLAIQRLSRQFGAAIAIQRLFRGFAARRLCLRMQAAVSVIQSGFRMLACRIGYLTIYDEIIKIQAHTRRFLTLCAISQAQRGSVIIQACFRGYAARRYCTRRQVAAAYIQSAARMHVVHEDYLVVLFVIIKIQTCLRRYFCIGKVQRMRVRMEENKRHRAASYLQACYRKLPFQRLLKSIRRRLKKVQACYRRHLAMRKYRYMLAAVLWIQRVMRGALGRLCTSRRVRAVFTLQEFCRSICYDNLMRQVDAQTLLSAAYRGFAERQQFSLTRAVAVYIQRWYRKHQHRRVFKLVSIQTRVRSHLCKNQYKSTVKLIVRIQSVIRMAVVRLHLQRLQLATVRVQSNARRHCARTEYRRTIASACSIQTVWRCHFEFQNYQLLRQYFVRIQSRYRCHSAVRTYQSKLYCFLVVQSLVRRWIARRACRKTVGAVIKIQTTFRRFLYQFVYRFHLGRIVKIQSIVRRFCAKLEERRLRRAYLWVAVKIKVFISRKLYEFSVRRVHNSLICGDEDSIISLLRSDLRDTDAFNHHFIAIMKKLKQFRFKTDGYCSYLHCLAKNPNINFRLFVERLQRDTPESFMTDVRIGFSDLYTCDAAGNTLLHHATMMSVDAVCVPRAQCTRAPPKRSASNTDFLGPLTPGRAQSVGDTDSRRSVQTLRLSNNSGFESQKRLDSPLVDRLAELIDVWMTMFAEHQVACSAQRAALGDIDALPSALQAQLSNTALGSLFRKLTALSTGCWLKKKRGPGPWGDRFVHVSMITRPSPSKELAFFLHYGKKAMVIGAPEQPRGTVCLPLPLCNLRIIRSNEIESFGPSERVLEVCSSALPESYTMRGEKKPKTIYLRFADTATLLQWVTPLVCMGAKLARSPNQTSNPDTELVANSNASGLPEVSTRQSLVDWVVCRNKSGIKVTQALLLHQCLYSPPAGVDHLYYCHRKISLVRGALAFVYQLCLCYWPTSTDSGAGAIAGNGVIAEAQARNDLRRLRISNLVQTHSAHAQALLTQLSSQRAGVNKMYRASILNQSDVVSDEVIRMMLCDSEQMRWLLQEPLDYLRSLALAVRNFYEALGAEYTQAETGAAVGATDSPGLGSENDPNRGNGVTGTDSVDKMPDDSIGSSSGGLVMPPLHYHILLSAPSPHVGVSAGPRFIQIYLHKQVVHRYPPDVHSAPFSPYHPSSLKSTHTFAPRGGKAVVTIPSALSVGVQYHGQEVECRQEVAKCMDTPGKNVVEHIDGELLNPNKKFMLNVEHEVVYWERLLFMQTPMQLIGVIMNSQDSETVGIMITMMDENINYQNAISCREFNCAKLEVDVLSGQMFRNVVVPFYNENKTIHSELHATVMYV